MEFSPPSHPPTWEGNWSHCSDYLSWLGGREELLLWLSLDSSGCVGKLGRGGGGSGYSRKMVQKFFNRSPITLKFGAEKLERESQERESESESEREQVVVFTFASCCCFTLVSWCFLLVSCYSTLVSWHSILVICCFTLVSCYFTLLICCSVLWSFIFHL